MKIGVFDSGVGGLSVANSIRDALPGLEVILREDKKHLPYGLRPPEEILGFVVPIFQQMVDDGCEVIVVACNTVTTTLINDLRELFKIPLVAVEPMVKPAAAATKSGVIAVCATPSTLASKRYKQLKTDFARDVKVIEPDCSDWTMMIESKKVDKQHIAERIETALEHGADVVVLACTHYHWIEDEVKQLATGRAQVMQPTGPLIEQLKKVIQREAD